VPVLSVSEVDTQLALAAALSTSTIVVTLAVVDPVLVQVQV